MILKRVSSPIENMSTPAGAVLGITLLGFATGDLGCCPAPEKKAAMLRIANYDYALPSWWDSVSVEVPKDLGDEEQIREYVRKQYGKDVGTKETWKKALKTWAVACQRLDHFPIYLAHCHVTGEEYERAAEIYTALYKLADGQKDKRDWYRAYLAYEAGKTFEMLKDHDKAAVWYSRSAEYVGSEDPHIDYIARKSAERLKQLDKK
jgi:hypothetical protein